MAVSYLLFPSVFLKTLTSALVILRHPDNFIAFENKKAEFVCQIIEGEDLAWTVNGRSVFSSDYLIPLNPDVKASGIIGEVVLTIDAPSQYNNSIVQCIIEDDNGTQIASEAAVMFTQGTVAEVGDLEVVYNVSSAVVTWTAPFSLDVTGVDHDIWYSVIIYNVTDENTPTVINCTDCINITDTHYTFTPSPCTVYNVSILPLNGAGQGNSSEPVTIQANDIQMKSVTSLNNKFCVVTLTLLCGVDMVNNISFIHDEVVYEATIHDQLVFINLPANRVFVSGVFEVNMDMGKVKGELHENICTYDIQRPGVESVGDGEIIVTGELIRGSAAIGIFLVIESSNNEISFVALNLSIEGGQSFSEVIQLPPSNYSVYIHDLEENGIPNIHPAHPYPLHVRVNGLYKMTNGISQCASITQNCSHVTVMCGTQMRNNSIPSCIVIYRAYNNSALNLIQKSIFLLEAGSEDLNYTVVVFMFDKVIDKEPCASAVITQNKGCNVAKSRELAMIHTSSSRTIQTPLITTDKAENKHVVIYVSSGLSAFVAALCVTAVILTVIMVRKNIASGNKAETRTVEYEEIDLPTTSSSARIDLQPNSAYATTTLQSTNTTAIETQPNSAYAITTIETQPNSAYATSTLSSANTTAISTMDNVAYGGRLLL